jgi:hypothetical protein
MWTPSEAPTATLGRCHMPRESAVQNPAACFSNRGCSCFVSMNRGCIAQVKGDSGLMRTVRFEHDRWTCDCPALGYCSHAIAVASSVVVNRTAGAWIDTDSLVTTGAVVVSPSLLDTGGPDGASQKIPPATRRGRGQTPWVLWTQAERSAKKTRASDVVTPRCSHTKAVMLVTLEPVR